VVFSSMVRFFSFGTLLVLPLWLSLLSAVPGDKVASFSIFIWEVLFTVSSQFPFPALE